MNSLVKYGNGIIIGLCLDHIMEKGYDFYCILAIFVCSISLVLSFLFEKFKKRDI